MWCWTLAHWLHFFYIAGFATGLYCNIGRLPDCLDCQIAWVRSLKIIHVEKTLKEVCNSSFLFFKKYFFVFFFFRRTDCVIHFYFNVYVNGFFKSLDLILRASLYNIYMLIYLRISKDVYILVFCIWVFVILKYENIRFLYKTCTTTFLLFL